jgi:hypothetical protein
MSRKLVRQAIAAYFAPPVVDGLSRVFTAPPRRVSGTDYFTAVGAGTQTGAVAFPFIEAEDEELIALTGTSSAKKRILYQAALRVEFASDQAKAEAAMDDHDDIIDAIKALLRADATMQAGGVIFQAGLGDTMGAKDIHVVSGMPKPIRKTGRLIVWTTVRFLVVEMI